jgi:hypothetical protein
MASRALEKLCVARFSRARAFSRTQRIDSSSSTIQIGFISVYSSCVCDAVNAVVARLHVLPHRYGPICCLIGGLVNAASCASPHFPALA